MSVVKSPSQCFCTFRYGSIPTTVVSTVGPFYVHCCWVMKQIRIFTDAEVISVPPEVGFVHHYRDCTNDYDYNLDCDQAAFVADTRLVDAGYIPTLNSRVRHRLDAVRRPSLQYRPSGPAATVQRQAIGT